MIEQSRTKEERSWSSESYSTVTEDNDLDKIYNQFKEKSGPIPVYWEANSNIIKVGVLDKAKNKDHAEVYMIATRQYATSLNLISMSITGCAMTIPFTKRLFFSNERCYDLIREEDVRLKAETAADKERIKTLVSIIEDLKDRLATMTLNYKMQEEVISHFKLAYKDFEANMKGNMANSACLDGVLPR